MTPDTAATTSALKEYLQQFPSIQLYTPEDEKFEAVRECFVVRPARPSAIVRPQSAEDVQALVRFCVEHDVDFSIRGGGHDVRVFLELTRTPSHHPHASLLIYSRARMGFGANCFSWIQNVPTLTYPQRRLLTWKRIVRWPHSGRWSFDD